VRVGSAAGLPPPSSGRGPWGAFAAGGVRAADGVHVDVAPDGRARGAGAGRAAEPAGAPPVHHRHDGAARKRGSRHRHRPAPRRGTPRCLGARLPRNPPRALVPPPAAWHTLAWAVFGGAYVGAVVFVAYSLRRPPGDVLLVLAAGSRLSAYVGATVGEVGFLRGFWMYGSQRLAWLEDYAASFVASA